MHMNQQNNKQNIKTRYKYVVVVKRTMTYEETLDQTQEKKNV